MQIRWPAYGAQTYHANLIVNQTRATLNMQIRFPGCQEQVNEEEAIYCPP